MPLLCSLAHTEYCETTRLCPTPGRPGPTGWLNECCGHLRLDCSRPATWRLRADDGWGQQYACTDHVNHPHFAAYRVREQL